MWYIGTSDDILHALTDLTSKPADVRPGSWGATEFPVPSLPAPVLNISILQDIPQNCGTDGYKEVQHFNRVLTQSGEDLESRSSVAAPHDDRRLWDSAA